ncbi:MAG: methionine synthase [Oligoflexales bacterium]|nr:methionine synthase [Oligoflexales bacterium]
MQKTNQHIVRLKELLSEKILFLDGAMGTMIQGFGLEEADFRAQRFLEHAKDLKGNNDLLCLTRPDVILNIHRQYLKSGVNILGTNTFNATSISQADYGLQEPHIVFEINQAAAQIAREAIRLEYPDETELRTQEHFVAGCVGPTNKTLTLSPDVNNPAYRAVTFEELKESYYGQISGLIAGGVDLLLVETVFDTLNLKACLFAISEYELREKIKIPLMISVTITDRSGRTFSGQTVEAFWYSIRHAKPLTVGINCALGGKDMRPYVEDLSRICDCFVSCYPNAGLPNPMSLTGYDETPEDTAKTLRDMAQSGLINLAGGCCGTTPAHIAEIVRTLRDLPPRPIPTIIPKTRLSGLTPLIIDRKSFFVMIGERTNVTGSQIFRKCILEKDYNKALKIARSQVENGANIIDINFDDGMLDSEECMTHFLNLIASEPDIANVPIMIDSSKWEVLEAGLRCIQGKGIVNSISLKEGEETFLRQASLIQRYGASVVIMAFDENGQAAERDEKVRISKRAYTLLTETLDFDPCDIIFDPNILTVGTGMAEHNNYAVDFIEALPQIQERCPYVLTSGGISNISFSFRGQNKIREAIHSCFLYHAIKNGLSMGIVNAGMIEVYEDLDPELRLYVEDLLLNRREDATERLLDAAAKYNEQNSSQSSIKEIANWRTKSLEERVSHALVHGLSDDIEADMEEALHKFPAPLDIIEGPLMAGMKKVGELFGDGKMFLPQVVKSARVMKKAVTYIEPFMKKGADGKAERQTTFVIATVKGDVHDIGKNIVGVVLACNNYKVIDLGVMVRCDEILRVAREQGADFIGLSGLITPSLDEMIFNAKEMTRQGFKIPLLIGGATTSKAHTAVKIAPHYPAPVCYVADASQVVAACNDFLREDKESFIQKHLAEQEKIRVRFYSQKEEGTYLPIEEARAKGFHSPHPSISEPAWLGVRDIHSITLDEIASYIDWSPFFWSWGMSGQFPKILESAKSGEQARSLFADAQRLLKDIIVNRRFLPKAIVGLWPALRVGDDVEIYNPEDRSKVLSRLCFLRQQRTKDLEESEESSSEHYLCLADYILAASPQISSHTYDYIGAFALSSGHEVNDYADFFSKKNDDYSSIIIKALGDRLAEAFAELLHKKARNVCGYGKDENLSVDDMIRERYRGIRPAPGYPACPDHTEKLKLWKLLDVERRTGITLTESFAMNPPSSVSGYYFFHEEARYFRVGKIQKDQMLDYSKRKDMPLSELDKWLSPNLAYEP